MKRFKFWLAKKIVKNILSSVTEDDILHSYGPNLYRGKEMLNPGQKHNIVSGARSLKNMDVYDVLMKDVKYVIHKRIHESATTDYDLAFSRGGLWAIELIEKKVTNLSKMK